jgi:hypothetical protein
MRRREYRSSRSLTPWCKRAQIRREPVPKISRMSQLLSLHPILLEGTLVTLLFVHAPVRYSALVRRRDKNRIEGQHRIGARCRGDASKSGPIMSAWFRHAQRRRVDPGYTQGLLECGSTTSDTLTTRCVALHAEGRFDGINHGGRCFSRVVTE